MECVSCFLLMIVEESLRSDWRNGVPGDAAEADATNDPAVNAVSTGLYAWLGAELCRETKDQSYCTNAYNSVWWLDRFMVNPDGLLWDHIAGDTCEVTDWTFTCRSSSPFWVRFEVV